MSEAIISAGQLKDIEVGDMIRVPVSETRAIAVYHLDEGVFATVDKCNHGEGYLSDGIVDGDAVECPIHMGRFHIPSGKPLCFPVKRAIRTYAVEVKDGEIFVDLSKAADGTPHPVQAQKTTT